MRRINNQILRVKGYLWENDYQLVASKFRLHCKRFNWPTFLCVSRKLTSHLPLLPLVIVFRTWCMVKAQFTAVSFLFFLQFGLVKIEKLSSSNFYLRVKGYTVCKTFSWKFQQGVLWIICRSQAKVDRN